MSRTMLVGLAITLLATGTARADPASSSPAGHQTGEEAAVLATVDRFVHAVSANDLRTMAAMQTPDGMTYVARVDRRGVGAVRVLGGRQDPPLWRGWVGPAQDRRRASSGLQESI